MFLIRKGDLTGRRRKLVRMVFDSLDPHGTGVVTVQEMLERYDVSQNPDVKVCVIYYSHAATVCKYFDSHQCVRATISCLI